MKHFITLYLAVFLCGPMLLAAPTVRISGKVLEADGEVPVPGAVVRLDENYLWSVTDADGRFSLDNVQQGNYTLEVSCLGYVTESRQISVRRNLSGILFRLSQNTLALKEVVVTAEKSKDNINTTQTIGRTALDHLQMNTPFPSARAGCRWATPPSRPPWKSTACEWEATPPSGKCPVSARAA